MLDSDSLAQIQQIVTAATHAVRQEIAAVEGRLSQVIADQGQQIRQELRQEMADQGRELRQEISAVEGRLRQEISGVEGRLRQEISGVEGRLRQEIVDTRRHMGVLDEGLRHELHLVAEAVQMQAERTADLRRDVDAHAQETRAQLRLSYTQLHQQVQDLDRRVFAIEQRLGMPSPA